MALSNLISNLMMALSNLISNYVMVALANTLLFDLKFDDKKVAAWRFATFPTSTSKTVGQFNLSSYGNMRTYTSISNKK